MNLEEQLDDMAVQASEDASNLHELRCKCQALDDELKFMRRADRMTSTPVKAEQVISLKSRVSFLSLCFPPPRCLFLLTFI